MKGLFGVNVYRACINL